MKEFLMVFYNTTRESPRLETVTFSELGEIFKRYSDLHAESDMTFAEWAQQAHVTHYCHVCEVDRVVVRIK